MFKTLGSRFVTVLVLFAVAMAAMFLLVMRELDIARTQELHQKLYRSLARQLVDEHIVPDWGQPDAANAQAVFARLRVINPRIDVYLLDNAGKIVTSSVRTRVVREQVDLAPLKQFFDEQATLPIFGDDPTEISRQRVFSAAPIRVPGERERYLYLVMRGLTTDSLADRVKSNHVIREILWVVLWCLVFAVLAGMLMVRFITKPLRRLTAVMDKFEQSGFADAQAGAVPARASNAAEEVNHLTSTFHAMADRLLDQMRVLRQNDAQRRELLANISHDLRTPIASVRGYLETLYVKADSLSEADKRQYVAIALKQSSQLGQLVDELFELAKLDAEQVTLLTEPFVLEDLAQDVVQQFELTARQKQISLRVQAPDDMPLVSADIGLIERVLRNLIDNALRYTPQGGTITVTLAASGPQVKVEVADTGSGINSEDLPRVFDRFYRGEKSRGDRDDANGHITHNAGLGLAICKRILELHGSTIGVTSQPGLTVFGFALNRV